MTAYQSREPVEAMQWDGSLEQAAEIQAVALAREVSAWPVAGAAHLYNGPAGENCIILRDRAFGFMFPGDWLVFGAGWWLALPNETFHRHYVEA